MSLYSDAIWGCSSQTCKCCQANLNKSILLLCRNLSCGKQKERQAMRDCPGLIDSLMSYVQSCVAEETPDEKVPCLVSLSSETGTDPESLKKILQYLTVLFVCFFSVSVCVCLGLLCVSDCVCCRSLEHFIGRACLTCVV